MSSGILFGKAGVSAGVVVNNASGSTAPSSGVNTIGGLDAAGNITPFLTDDLFFSFVVPNTTTPAQTGGVSFTLGDMGGDLDSFQIRAFNLADMLIETQNVGNPSRFPVSLSSPNIHRVEVIFLSDPAGYALDDLTFNTPGAAAAATPEPSSLALLGGGSLLTFLRRRRR